MGSIPTQLSDADLAVSTRALCKKYGKQTALQDVNLQVPVGAVYLLVGPNGSGKSTTLKLLLDLVRANSGVAQVFGLDVRGQAPQVRANIGYVPERSDWGYSWMKVGHLLEHHARYYTSWDTSYASHLAKVFEVQLDRTMNGLSKGQARRVHLLMALAHRPPLLLLDEPTDGLDPVMRSEIQGILADHLSQTQTTVIISTHHVEEVERFADHIGVLREGHLRAQLSLEQLRLGLHRYRAEVPTGWSGVQTPNDVVVLHRVASGREIQWTVWGDKDEVLRQFSNANAAVRDVTQLSLLDAAVTLLNPQG